MVKTAERRANQLLKRAQQLWDTHYDRLPKYIILYRMKQELQNKVKEFVREVMEAELRTIPMEDGFIHWMIDAPLSLEDCKQVDREGYPSEERQNSCDAEP